MSGPSGLPGLCWGTRVPWPKSKGCPSSNPWLKMLASVTEIAPAEYHDLHYAIMIIAHMFTQARSARWMHIETTSQGGFTDANWNAHINANARFVVRMVWALCSKEKTSSQLITGVQGVWVWTVITVDHNFKESFLISPALWMNN